MSEKNLSLGRLQRVDVRETWQSDADMNNVLSILDWIAEQLTSVSVGTDA